MTAHGPYEQEPLAEARQAAPFVPGQDWRASHRRIIEAALGDVELGSYDRRVLQWLSNWDPSTPLVIAGWIERTRQRPAARAQHWRVRFDVTWRDDTRYASLTRTRTYEAWIRAADEIAARELLTARVNGMEDVAAWR